MTKRTRKQTAPVGAVSLVIATAADLVVALARLTADASAMLGTSPWSAMYRTVSGGHTNKRGIYVAAIRATEQGDGSLDTLAAFERQYAVPALRAEHAYALATGDLTYFRGRDGRIAKQWAPIVKADALDPDATDAALGAAFLITCSPAARNTAGMLGEITLTARKRNVTPLPVFADVVKWRTVAMFDAELHGTDGYQAQGYGNATFTLTPPAKPVTPAK